MVMGHTEWEEGGTEERKTQWEFGYGTLGWDWREGQGNGNLVLVQSERTRGRVWGREGVEGIDYRSRH